MAEFLSRLLMILTLRCDKASWLISESLDRKLLLHERLALRGHQLACRACPIVEKQLRLIRQASQRTAMVSEITLSDSAKERFKEAVRRAETN